MFLIIAQDDDDFLDSLSDEGKSVCTVDEAYEDSDRDISARSKREVREDLQSKVCLFFMLSKLSYSSQGTKKFSSSSVLQFFQLLCSGPEEKGGGGGMASFW